VSVAGNTAAVVCFVVWLQGIVLIAIDSVYRNEMEGVGFAVSWISGV
jgi:hypothetical protein